MTAYTMLYGRPAFYGDSLPSLYDAIRSAPIVWPALSFGFDGTDPSSVAGQEPRALAIVRQLLHRTPDLRISISAALEAFTSSAPAARAELDVVSEPHRLVASDCTVLSEISKDSDLVSGSDIFSITSTALSTASDGLAAACVP